jgi:hypothetical protein
MDGGPTKVIDISPVALFWPRRPLHYGKLDLAWTTEFKRRQIQFF